MSPPSSPDSEQGHAYPPAHDLGWGNQPFLGEQRRARVPYRTLVSAALFVLLVAAIAALGGTSDVVSKLNEQKNLAVSKGSQAIVEWKEWFTNQEEIEDELTVSEEFYAAGTTPSQSDNSLSATPTGYTHDNAVTVDASEEGADSGWEDEQESNTADESEAAAVEDDTAAESSESEVAAPATGPIFVSTQPRPRLADPNDRETKYMSYIPHSGFHNQRIELEFALQLGHLLNRTVLVPPIWLGWPAPSYPSDKLQKIWTGVVADHGPSFELNDTSLESPLSQPLTFNSIEDRSSTLHRGMERHVRRATDDCTGAKIEACRHVYNDTFFAWDFLSNLDSLAEIVPIVDRWDMRPRAMLESLGLSREDVIYLKNEDRYEFQFSDIGPLGEPDSPLFVPAAINTGHDWKRRVSIGALRQRPERLLMIGTMFGAGKVESQAKGMRTIRERILRAMAFRNPWLTTPADDIAHRLGDRYLAIHARIADGGFFKGAKQNMEITWRGIMKQLKVPEEVTEGIWSEAKPGRGQLSLDARGHIDGSEEHAVDYSFLDQEEGEDDLPLTLINRRAFDEAPATEWTPRELSCRSALYDEPQLLALNQPLYLATDSRDPVNDPHLSIFFSTFPCIFILSDFRKPSSINEGAIVDSLERMGRLVNEADGVPIGKTMIPFLEALIAARADVVVGTRWSTFSSFTKGALHRVQEAEKEGRSG